MPERQINEGGSEPAYRAYEVNEFDRVIGCTAVEEATGGAALSHAADRQRPHDGALGPGPDGRPNGAEGRQLVASVARPDGIED